VNPAKMAEPIEVSFGSGTLAGCARGLVSFASYAISMHTMHRVDTAITGNHVLYGGAHWRHLANTIKWINLCGNGDVTCRYHCCVNSLHLTIHYIQHGWLGNQVVSVLDSGTEGSGFKLQPRHCRVTALGKLFTPIMPLFTKQRNWYQPS